MAGGGADLENVEMKLKEITRELLGEVSTLHQRAGWYMNSFKPEITH